ncbi:MAG: hypothetical protein AAGF83_20185 [Cyanobacteria bacterium P01_G01_bin.67]
MTKPKKNWQKPQLTIYGALENLTQANLDGFKEVKGFISISKNLNAILSM